MSAPVDIGLVTDGDLEDLLPLVRAYLDFYEVGPSDDDVLALCRALIADPDNEGVQLLARDWRGRAVGFATVFWTWSTTRAARVAVMNDLFVVEHARGSGVADALIAACAERARAHGAKSLSWQTAPNNRRAQAVYERTGASSSTWLEYDLDL